MELINFLNRTFWGDSGYLTLLVLSMIYIMGEKRGEERGKRIIIYTIIALIGIIWNPLIAPYGLIFFGEDQWAYMRIFYLVPLMTIIAYAGTLFYTSYVKNGMGRRQRIWVIVFMILTIAFSGKLYEPSMFREVTNIYKIDQDALEISNCINEDCDSAKVNIMVPWTTDIVYGIRQYTGNLILIGSTDSVVDYNELQEIEAEQEIDYFVVTKNRDIDIEPALQADNFEVLGETENCLIYKKLEN